MLQPGRHDTDLEEQAQRNSGSLLILLVLSQMFQYSARLRAEVWEWAPPRCRGIAALFICISQARDGNNCGCRERERAQHKTLPPAHIHKTSQSSPKSISCSHLHPAGAVSMGRFQVGERLQLSVVAILGMLFYRLDLLWFG